MAGGLRHFFLVCALGAGAALPAAALAASAPDEGEPFRPEPVSQAVYGIAPPSANPALQRGTVTAADGTSLYVEAWLPAASDEHVPPARVPVVVHYSPYLSPGRANYAMPFLVERGYAFMQAHVRGTGGSGGCVEQTGDAEVSDGARIVEHAGTAPFSDGNVGTIGVSYPGATQIATATGPDRARLSYLKAMVVGAPVASAYEFFHHDGVPHVLQATGSAAKYFGQDSLGTGGPAGGPGKLAEKVPCQPSVFFGSLDTSGNYTEHYEARDHTRNLERLEAATLMFHGHADRRVAANQQPGLFDEIPETTPHKGVFGWFDHELPDRMTANGPSYSSPRLDWERADVMDGMVPAWFDRYLKGVEASAPGASPVSDWPVAQVQRSDGQWRAEGEWPGVGGSSGSLALGPGGVLGASELGGSTSYVEGTNEFDDDRLRYAPGTFAVWETPPLSSPLEIVGQPVLDAWVRLDRPDAHFAVKIEALGPDGKRTIPEAWAVGLRSAQHLAPLDGSRFRQRSGSLAPLGVPFPVSVRLDPTDLYVPAGGRLRLTMSGGTIVFDGLEGIDNSLGVL
ncbi:MAG TPA: CocE/NonD family hydrolase, partial [Thermoleophilaceae bacterium]|nr:CocE/NonD family hydrolase [Thermoleophilaceae bacterium]